MASPRTQPRPRDTAASCPPLESGDRLTSVEFERRYSLRPDIHRAELIEGVVVVASPMRWDEHSVPQHIISNWVGAYELDHPEVQAGDGGTLRLDAENVVQPDTVLRRRTGASRKTDDGYLTGAPELVIEVSASTASVDLGPKLRAYRRNGVQEYIVWQIYESRVDWFELRDGEYILLPLDRHGIIESRVFPGLRLNVEALLAMDMARVVRTQTAKRRPR